MILFKLKVHVTTSFSAVLRYMTSVSTRYQDSRVAPRARLKLRSAMCEPKIDQRASANVRS